MSGIIYFAHPADGGPIKIGQTTGPMERLSGLQAMHFSKVEFIATIPGGPVREVMLHQRFAAHRLHGEYFRPHRELWQAIIEAQDSGDIADLPPEPEQVATKEEIRAYFNARGLTNQCVADLLGNKLISVQSAWSAYRPSLPLLALYGRLRFEEARHDA